jgi:recombination protein RecT
MSNIRPFFERDDVKSKFSEILGKNATSFITAVLQIANGNEQLKSCDPATLYSAAMAAATLNLPINPNLGFAYIVPYKGQASFQMGYKGFIQLAQRSGQFKSINVCKVYENDTDDIVRQRLTSIICPAPTSDKVIGYSAYFALLNGFESTFFMSIAEVEKHAKKYSQTYKKGFGVWKDEFDAMAMKTVLKLLLSKYAPLSTEMQRAVIADQSVIRDNDTLDVDYIDNSNVHTNAIDDKEADRIRQMLTNCATIEDVDVLADGNEEVVSAYGDLFTDRKKELSNEKRK